MFAKLLTIILVLGAVTSVLLVNRQRRLELAHESAGLYRQITTHRQAVWASRCEIERRCRPESIRLAAESLEVAWSPVLQEPVGPTAPLRLAAGH